MSAVHPQLGAGRPDMKQSDMRAAGRSAGSAWAPRFEPGADEVDEVPVAAPVTLEGLDLVLPVRVVPGKEYLEALYQAVKETTYRAVIDGTHEAVEHMMADTDDDEQAAGGSPSPG